ncbi:MAG: uroporphyrinogen-III C-methyltransferase [Proteobacteria bacterium]|nr:uroporphyrinogen-III C-methyltransferase [Pseudomonadota bacterium]
MSKNKDSTENDTAKDVAVEKPALESPGEKQAEKPVAKPQPAKKVVPAPGSANSPRKGSSAVAWLALLLVLGVAAAVVWGGRELLSKEAQMNARLAELEAIAVEENTDLADLGAQWERQLEAANSSRVEADTRQAEKLQAIENRLLAQREELARFGATDRQDWLLAEAQYLLRLANQRLIMADDVVAAKALLRSADSILVELEDVNLHDVRAAIAADLAAVRAVPKRDIQGIYLNLAALIEQAGKLVIFQLPEDVERPPVTPAENWQARLQQGYEEALLKLSDYVIIRRRDVPIEALMDPQWEGLVRQNLRMLLEQAQVALLSGNQVLFRESLSRASHWVAEFFEADEAAAKALAQEISVLKEKNIAVVMPDISRSLAAVDVALERRMQRGGGE